MKTLNKTFKFILLSAMLFVSIRNAAADNCPEQLIADETFYQCHGEKEFKIITCNESIRNMIEKRFRSNILRAKVLIERSKYGETETYIYFFDRKDEEEVVKFLELV